MSKITKKFFNILIIISLFANFCSLKTNQKPNLSNIEIRWDWSKIEPINISNFKFPENFIWGVCTSAHQVEGNCNCQWTNFEKNKNLEQANLASDHYNRYRQDIDLLKNLGVAAYRFSIEWSKIEPFKNQFNLEVIQHYHDLIDYLIANNITPVITLHHFTHPQWFEDIGAFEKEENIKHFVSFAKNMFKQYAHKVNMWCTINEPGVYAFQGYIFGAFPPAKPDIQMAGTVSKNLILAHIQTYKSLKSMPYGDKAQIGITHSITQFDPYHKDNKFEKSVCHNLNKAFYDAILQFFITGKFEYKVPALLQLLSGKFPKKFRLYSDVTYEYKNYNPKDILDFFGIQPYSHVLFNWANPTPKPSLREGDIATDMPYCIYPESLYRAINQASFIGVPIYVTENGIADAKDDRRELFIRRYIYAMHKAIKDGYDVRGYFYWSLLDNFEWNLGFGPRFGLYEVDYKTLERKLRKGALIYKQIVENYNNKKIKIN